MDRAAGVASGKAARILHVAPKTLRLAAEAGEVEAIHPLPDHLRHTRERLVPARFQFACHQPVGRIGGIILPKGAVGRVARRFKVAFQSVEHLVAVARSLSPQQQQLRWRRGLSGCATAAR